MHCYVYVMVVLMIVFISVPASKMNFALPATCPYTPMIVLDLIWTCGSVSGSIYLSLNFKECLCVGLWINTRTLRSLPYVCIMSWLYHILHACVCISYTYIHIYIYIYIYTYIYIYVNVFFGCICCLYFFFFHSGSNLWQIQELLQRGNSKCVLVGCLIRHYLYLFFR